MNGKRTHNDYVRFDHGHRRWYQAVLDDCGIYQPLRLSRKQFKRGRDAAAHRVRVLARLKSMKAREEIHDVESRKIVE